uniref:30S ribosomal protein S13 n=1 Tax=Nitzschia alba TaxID=2858 RepID=A0A5C0F2R3_NITAL|nr:30S ribosomal protein S13 [Nitzschia alba]QEI59602.1 30S ribosomal protein S13 [Nitzschia alba]
MIKLIGIDLPQNKKVKYSLTKIYGIGIATAKNILTIAKISFDKKTCDLSFAEIKVLRQILQKNNIKLEGDLRRFKDSNINKLIEINCYKGRRHKQKLPVHGQRTRTNSRTKRDKKKLKKKLKKHVKTI